MLFGDQTVNIYDETKGDIPQIMKTDIKEKEGNYLLEIELPGFSKDEVLAELVDGKLTIIASKKETIEKDGVQIRYIRRERMTRECRRSFYVGKRVKQEDITAAFKDGVLNIIISNPEIAVDREERKLIPIQ